MQDATVSIRNSNPICVLQQLGSVGMKSKLLIRSHFPDVAVSHGAAPWGLV